DGAFYVNNDNYGQKGCIIFRPDDIEEYKAGDSYDVNIVTGLSSGDVSYTVNFFNLEYIENAVLIPYEPEKPASTAEPAKNSGGTKNQNTAQNQHALKKLKLSSVKCAKNTKKITGKVSVSNASVKIKVGRKAYKKASVKGKKFTLKLNYKLKRKTKITVKVGKKGYNTLIKSYTVK
ncbi:MAG: hypothetical protein K2K09_04925, partial [Lachnospiraceae bacterium]|nr:hypothetical protein [Lachnospiraceae bacterium]